MPLNLVADLHSGVPVYRQIIEQIRFHIASGLLAPGDELPSTRALSTELALNPMTVSKAYSQLERDGLVERRPGLPLVVRLRSGRTAASEQFDQLSRLLAPAVRAAHQLGVSADDAVDTYRALLDAADRTTRGNS